MNFVTARRIIAVHAHRRVGQFAEISRPARMIQDHFLVKSLPALPEFGWAHLKKLRRALQDFDHPIDLLHRVVEIEAGAGCAGHAKPAHQRLVAMMAAAHGQARVDRRTW